MPLWDKILKIIDDYGRGEIASKWWELAMTGALGLLALFSSFSWERKLIFFLVLIILIRIVCIEYSVIFNKDTHNRRSTFPELLAALLSILFLFSPISEIRSTTAFNPNKHFPSFISQQQRKEYGTGVASIEIDVEGIVRNASVRLLWISKNNDGSEPLNKYVEPLLPWPASEKSFLPRDIVGIDYIIFAIMNNDDNSFTVPTHFGLLGDTASEMKSLENIQAGTYYAEIVLYGDNIVPLRQKLKLSFAPGNINIDKD